jgi:hypothetical protein
VCRVYIKAKAKCVGRLGKVKCHMSVGRGVGDSSISKSNYQFSINLLFPFRLQEKATHRT